MSQQQEQQEQQQLRCESNFINSIRSNATRKTYEFRFNKFREFVKEAGHIFTAKKNIDSDSDKKEDLK